MEMGMYLYITVALLIVFIVLIVVLIITFDQDPCDGVNHKWVYTDNTHRECSKCGLIEGIWFDDCGSVRYKNIVKDSKYHENKENKGEGI